MDVLELAERKRIKRIFRRKYKIDFPGAISHITQRAPGKELLFLEEADYLYMLHLIKEKAGKFNLDVFCFSLMLNHLHIQLRSNEGNLSKAMKNLFESYADFFNKKYGRKGHVFCGTFGQALCLDDNYLLATSIYIHLNPVRAGIVEDSADYRWSSCGLYVSPTERKTFIDYKFILQTLSPDIYEAKSIYKELLVEGSAIKTKEVSEQPEAVENFKREIVRFFPKTFSSKILVPNIEKKDLFDEELERKIEELKGKQRLGTPHEFAARRYLVEQLKARGYTVTEIAKKLNLTRPTVYTALTLQK